MKKILFFIDLIIFILLKAKIQNQEFGLLLRVFPVAD